MQYYADNLPFVRVYGAAVPDESPRIGHPRITVVDAPCHWAVAGNKPLVLNGMPSFPYHRLSEVVDPYHRMISGKTVSFIISGLKKTVVRK